MKTSIITKKEKNNHTFEKIHPFLFGLTIKSYIFAQSKQKCANHGK